MHSHLVLLFLMLTLNILLFAKKLEELHAVTYEEHLNFSVIAFERKRRRVYGFCEKNQNMTLMFYFVTQI